MRVVCPTVEEFIERLDDVKQRGDTLFENAINVSTYRRPQGGNPREAVVFNVVLQASCVVVMAGGREYVVETGVQCGDDYEDKTQDKGGSIRAGTIRDTLAAFATENGWRLLPGIIDQVF